MKQCILRRLDTISTAPFPTHGANTYLLVWGALQIRVIKVQLSTQFILHLDGQAHRLNRFHTFSAPSDITTSTHSVLHHLWRGRYVVLCVVLDILLFILNGLSSAAYVDDLTQEQRIWII